MKEILIAMKEIVETLTHNLSREDGIECESINSSI